MILNDRDYSVSYMFETYIYIPHDILFNKKNVIKFQKNLIVHISPFRISHTYDTVFCVVLQAKKLSGKSEDAQFASR